MRHRTLLLLLLLLLLFLPRLKTHPPGRGNTVALRTEQRQNRAQKLPNARFYGFPNFYTTVQWDIEPSCCSCCCCCSSSRGWKRTLPDGETQWPWRTEQRQNRAQKLPNVPFWNPRKTIVLDKVLWFSTNFYTTVSTMRHRTLLLLLLLLLLFLPRLKTHPPGRGNTVALKDGTAPKSSPKTA